MSDTYALRHVRTNTLEIAYTESGSADGTPVVLMLAERPSIGVPTITLHGAGDGVGPLESSLYDARFFTGPYQRRVIPVVGHNLPQEAPEAIVQAVRDLL
jgi:pimeloyl-ACP methyl ester carboxylesterase